MRSFAFLVLFFSLSTQLFSEEVAVLTFIQGKVSFIASGKTKAESVKLNQILKAGDSIQTENGICELQLATQATIRIEKFSRIFLEDILNPKTKQTKVRAMAGKLFVKVHKHEKTKNHQLSVVSPSYVAGVRGTEFIVSNPDEGGTNPDLDLESGVFVNEGSVAVSGPDKKEVMVKQNEEIVLKGKDFKKQILSNYAKEKMQIFQKLSQMKEENYQLFKEQHLNNQKLMEEMKGKTNE
ncbi:sigma factor regulatory protein, FecR/PupR family [Leptospira ryugenii]|uniref:Sigma factor regulatory protein, FecR/PupR family n=1 Tax=Leptospira ryugenii TaxID=1917863 RepID=A0A2P2E0Q5_9LEPT|nr:FecR family protein [Leptospira ryugenii]GBF50468.1 sigma factor regulatory protein, FecR/PupR family [Leptospira ryugenii]